MYARFVHQTDEEMGRQIKLHKKKNPVYKYAINEQLDMLPRTMKTKEVLEHLKQFGITRNEFYADRNIAWGSEKAIPSDRLIKYAKVFDCTLEELMNELPVATSIRQSKLGAKSIVG